MKNPTEEGFFNRNSTIWQVNREMALLIAGGRALLMQVAHPRVAAGVAQHSRFQEDPFARLYRTMNAMWSIVFDEKSQARTALERIGNVHARVKGTVHPGEPSFAGASYDANDQKLLLWVHATLIDSAIVGYERFVTPMTLTQKQTYYEDSKGLGALFGIREELIPKSIGDFESYMNRALAGNEIAIGATARTLAREILYARPWIFKVAGPLFRFVTIGLLPEKLREKYGLEWSDRRERAFASLSKVIRAIHPLVPAVIRVVPNARRAEKASRR